ncbi:hypothetical protein YC2023_070795 [Brassica napus]
MDILTENEILGIFRRISEEIPILRNIPMKYRGNNIPRKTPTNIRGYIIAATEPLGDFKKFRGNSEEKQVFLGISSEYSEAFPRK